MNLIDAPIEAQEQYDESSAYDPANALCKAKLGWQDKLPLSAGKSQSVGKSCPSTRLARFKHPEPTL
jgi:hypothetical protein